MQIQSSPFMYQTPQAYGFPQASYSTQPNNMLSQGGFSPQSQSDQSMNLLVSLLTRVLDFAFNLITQLTGQKSGPSFKSALAPTDAAQFSNTAGPSGSSSLLEMGAGLFDSVTSSLGITKVLDSAVDSAKGFFGGGGFLKTATKIGGMIAGIF